MIEGRHEEGWTLPDRPPILEPYERSLQPLIGFLSHFIVRKQYERATNRGASKMDRARAKRLMVLVLDEVGLLIGPTQTSDLREKLSSINDRFYPMEAVHEG